MRRLLIFMMLLLGSFVVAFAQTQISSQSGTINGYGYVDLGLSVKWATCNIGASSPSDYGSYYAWGEAMTKPDFAQANSATYKKNVGSVAGDPNHDAACANWGGTWRLPTAEEIDELASECTCIWTMQGGHCGYKVTGPNGNSIFLPAAGWLYGDTLLNAEDIGRYWSATPDEDYTDSAYHLSFYNGYFSRFWYTRSYGFSVRPVSE